MSGVLQAMEPRLVLFGLVLTRISGLFLALPMLSGEIVPLRLRAAAAAAIAFVLSMPMSTAPLPQGPAALGAAAVGELLVGVALGLLVRLALGAAEAMGSLLSMQMGLGFSGVVDPLTQSEGPLAALFALAAWALLLALNGHHELLRGVNDSLRALPPGAALRGGAEPLLLRLVESGGQIFAAALRIATPVAAALLGTNVAMALLARVAPKVNLLMLSFLIAAGMGLLALAISGPSMARAMSDHLLTALGRMRAFALGR